jgi:hypothetical protein
MGAVILIGSGLLLYALRKVIPFWLGCVILFVPWGIYNYFYDDTRVGHPDYKNSSSYSSCLKTADIIYRDNLEEALADPAVWQLGGYKSAIDYAATSKRSVISRCKK